eukprot:4972174-Pleurochrysis_carterae.AAC.2
MIRARADAHTRTSTHAQSLLSAFPADGRACVCVSRTQADPKATYYETLDINLDELKEPVLCAPNDPDDARLLSEVTGEKIDEVFIGSCMTNIGHFRAAGKLLNATESSLPTRLWVAPPTKMDAAQLVDEGARTRLHSAQHAPYERCWLALHFLPFFVPGARSPSRQGLAPSDAPCVSKCVRDLLVRRRRRTRAVGMPPPSSCWPYSICYPNSRRSLAFRPCCVSSTRCCDPRVEPPPLPILPSSASSHPTPASYPFAAAAATRRLLLNLRPRWRSDGDARPALPDPFSPQHPADPQTAQLSHSTTACERLALHPCTHENRQKHRGNE